MGQRRSTNSECVITHRLRVESGCELVSVGQDFSEMGQCQSRNSEYVITHPLIFERGRKWVSVGREIWNMCYYTPTES